MNSRHSNRAPCRAGYAEGQRCAVDFERLRPQLLRVAHSQSVSSGLSTVLTSLSPVQRSAFLLHDVFGYPFAQVATLVGRSPQTARQIATRARQAVAAGPPRYPASAEEHRELVDAFLRAAEDGDTAALLGHLPPADADACAAAN